MATQDSESPASLTKSRRLFTTMANPIYPQSAYRRFPIQGFVVRQNRRRRRWPVTLLSFLLGLLAGWLLCGGGAWFQ